MRTPKEAFSFIRTVLRNPHIQVSPDQHHDDYSRWYFKIEIFDVKDGNVVWVLEAGKSYHINVYTSRNLNNNSQQVEEQNSIFIETPISISLKSSPPLISIEPTEYQVEPHIHRDKTYEFNVQVEKRSPKGNYQLVLYYQEAKSKNPQIITVLNLQVEGDEIGSDFVQGLCKEAHVNLEKGIPEDTAIIYIVSPRAGILEIKGWGHNAELPRTTFPQFPNLSLAKFMDSKVGPEKIWLKNHIYSMSGPIPLIKWFKKISNQCEKSFSLIIADYTLSEFPWEILQIQTGIYLGTLARIVRWIEIQVSDTYETLLPDYEKYSGTVVAYIDSEIPKNNRERDSLELCHTTYFESADSL